MKDLSLTIIAVNKVTKEELIVERIVMGQSSTSVYFINGHYGNSVHYDFYHNKRLVNIYQSSLFNGYCPDCKPITYEDELEVVNKPVAKQIIAEYYSQDGSIERAMTKYLEAHPGQIVKFMGVTQNNYQGKYNELVYGSYALVVYGEEVK